MYDEKQTALIDAAIRAVARDGLEKTTTRSIGAAAGINDAYIYRYFSDKEDLLSRAYILVNEQLINLLLRLIGDVKARDGEDLQDRFAYVIRGLWDVLLNRSEACIFCDYYYHSASYKKYAAAHHHDLALQLLDKLGEGHKLDDQAEFSLYHMMETLFAFAAKAVEGYYPKTEEAFRQVVQRLYTAFCTIITV